MIIPRPLKQRSLRPNARRYSQYYIAVIQGGMGENVAYLETDVGLTTYTCSHFAGFSRFVILRERERRWFVFNNIARRQKRGERRRSGRNFRATRTPKEQGKEKMRRGSSWPFRDQGLIENPPTAPCAGILPARDS